MICVMHNLTVGVFKILEITSNIDFDKSINYTQRILRVTALNKYKQVLAECKELMKGLAIYQKTLGATNNVTMEQFWYWSRLDDIEGLLDILTGTEQ